VTASDADAGAAANITYYYCKFKRRAWYV
jgi:hypothetical protein